MLAPNWHYAPFYDKGTGSTPITLDAHNPVIYASHYQQMQSSDPAVSSFNATASAYDTNVIGPEGPNVVTYNIATTGNDQSGETYQPVK
jgi:hypothetical protein